MPRVQVPAEHHDFLCLVGARNLGDDVVLRAALGIRLVHDRRFDLHRASAGHQPRDAAVVLVAHHHRGHGLGHVERAVVERANLPMLTPRVVDAQRRPGLDEEHVELLGELIGGEWRRCVWRSAAAAAGAGAPNGDGGGLGENCARASLSSRRLAGGSIVTSSLVGWPTITARPLRLPRRCSKNLSRSCCVGRSGGVMSTVGRGDRARRAGRPRQRLHHEAVFHRRHEVHRRLLVQPSRAAEVPLLEMRVLQPPRRGLLQHPVLRSAQVGRAGQSRTVHVGQHLQRSHDLGVVHRLATDFPDRVGVHTLGGFGVGLRGRLGPACALKADHGRHCHSEDEESVAHAADYSATTEASPRLKWNGRSGTATAYVEYFRITACTWHSP